MTDIISAPSKGLLAVEFPRGALEYLSGLISSFHLAEDTPHRGDGGPVLVRPGLGTADGATSMLRRFLEDIGFVSYGWNRGFNRGPVGELDEFIGELVGDLVTLHARHGAPVRVIGWSLGGVYAREMAKRAPHLVRQVVTLGTPFKGTADSTNGAALFQLLSGTKMHEDADLLRRLAEDPSVPTMSVYSKTDGVVAWQASQLPERPHLQNVELSDVSHLGMVCNPQVYRLLAEKLTAPASAASTAGKNVVEVNFRRRGMRKAA